MRKTPTRRHGFTLVELLVVMGIIALLAALLTPALMSAIESANRGATRQEILGLETGMNAFHTKFGFYPPHRLTHENGRPIYMLADRNPADGTRRVRRVFEVVKEFTGLGLQADEDVRAAQCLTLFLWIKWVGDWTSATEENEFTLVKVDPQAADPYDPQFHQAVQKSGGPFFDDFPDAPYDDRGRVRLFFFIDRLGVEGRTGAPGDMSVTLDNRGMRRVPYYQFENNTMKVLTATGMRDPSPVIDVNSNGVDIWSSGPDGYDLIGMFGGGASNPPNPAFQSVVAALNTDGRTEPVPGFAQPIPTLTKSDLPLSEDGTGAERDTIIVDALDPDDPGEILRMTVDLDDVTNW